MAEQEIKVSIPPISLETVPGPRNLIVSWEAFGPNSFNQNIADMQKPHSYGVEGKIVTFREPTSAESILATTPYFTSRAKPIVFDLRCLQTGRIVRTLEGVYVNIPKDAPGNPITDEQILKSFLDNCEKINGIWLYNGNDATLRDFGYAPHETFKQGVQDGRDFAEGGLARVLEHTEKTAEALKEIASEKNYAFGVNVIGFEPANPPLLRVVSLFSNRNLKRYLGGQLIVDGAHGGFADGFAFGVLDDAKGIAKRV